MSDLIIRKPNGLDQASAVKVRYRVSGTTTPFVEIDLLPNQLPYRVTGASPALYELGVKQLVGSTWSEWATGFSDGLKVPTQFTAVRNGANFNIIYTIPEGIEHFQIEFTDPNGGKSLKDYDGEGSGTEIVAIEPFLEGEWKLQMRSAYNLTDNPIFASKFTDPVYVQVGTACNPPIIGAITDGLDETNTITKNIAFSSYSTPNVRIRVVDNELGSEIRNDLITGTGTVAVILFKEKSYTVQIFNQCSDGGEQSDSVEISTVTAP